MTTADSNASLRIGSQNLYNVKYFNVSVGDPWDDSNRSVGGSATFSQLSQLQSDGFIPVACINSGDSTDPPFMCYAYAEDGAIDHSSKETAQMVFLGFVLNTSDSKYYAVRYTVSSSDEYSMTVTALSGSEYTAGTGISISDGTVAIASPAVNEINNSWTENAARRQNASIGQRSHTEGINNVAKGAYSHAEGYYNEASGESSHTEGDRNTASGASSHAEGSNTISSGTYSHAEGRGTRAQRAYQHVCGEYNILDTTGTATTMGTYVEIVGNGTSTEARSNARTLDWDGTGWFAGDVTCDAVQGTHGNLYSLRSIGAIVASVPSMEYGTSNSITVSAGSHTAVDVTFAAAKTEAPVVFPAIQCATAGVNLIATVQSVTNSQASIVVTNLGTTDVEGVTVDWLALSGR